MSDLIQALIQWVTANPQWTGGIVFLIALSESLAIVGMLVPGVVMMFAVGALIGAGAADFWVMYWLSVAGAVLGDGLSFWLGHRLRGRVADLWPFSRHPETLERGAAFFGRYGGKSVAFGRFFGPVRAVIPLVAGMLSMPPARFLVANVLSALAWAFAYLAPGIVLGASLELASEVAVHLVVLVLVLVAGIWLAGWIGHHIFRRLQPASSRFVQWLLAREESGWGGRVAAALADPAHPEARGLAVFAGVLMLTVALLVLTLTLVAGDFPLTAVGVAVEEGLASLRTPLGDHAMVFVTALGDGWLTAVLSLAVFVVLVMRGGVVDSVSGNPASGAAGNSGDRRSAWYWLAAVAFAFLVPPLLKYGLRLPRPYVAAGQSPWGFPSGHALRATVLYGFLGVMAASLWPPARRWPLYWMLGLLVFFVGFSRLYLGVHWLSDVVGGVLLGALWVAALGLAYRHHPHGYPRGWQLLGVAAVVLAIGLLVQAGWRQAAEVARYDPPQPVIEIPLAEWAASGTGLPATRDGLLAGRAAPLNISYAGDPQWLGKVLAADGWQPAERLGWHNALKLLSTTLPLAELPVLPQVHDARHDQWLWVRDDASGRRLALRLWPASVRLLAEGAPDGLPLWQGNIGILEREVILGWVAFPRDAGTEPDPAVLLEKVAGLAALVLTRSPLRILGAPGIDPHSQR